MATLVSPGVSVTVSDESQYAAATQGTLPLLVIATASNKTDASAVLQQLVHHQQMQVLPF